MGTYLITGPDGKKYKISGDTPEGAMQALKKHMGGEEPAAKPVSDDPGALSYFKKAGDLASYANPGGVVGSWLGENIVRDIKGEGKDERDTTLGKIDTLVRGGADTLSFGMADEIAALGKRTSPLNPENYSSVPAALETLSNLNPINNVISQGKQLIAPDERFEKDLATERATDRADAENRFGEHLTGQLAGGMVQGAGLVKNGLSLSANAANKGASLWKMSGLGAVDGGTLAAAQGFGSGEGVRDRMKKAAIGTIAGTVLGGVTPGLIAGGKEVFDRATASFSPEAAKDKIMAAILKRSGLTVDDVAARLQGAQDDGQNMFMTADALELPGQRIMSTAVRTPNDARKSVYDALLNRQMDQGRRVAADLTDASGSPLTADQYKSLLSSKRAEDAARNYAPVSADQTAIDVSSAVDRANKAISPVADNLATVRGDVPTDLASRSAIEAQESSIRDPIRQALIEARSYLASDNLTVTNVEKAFRAKTNIDAMISKATENGQGAMVNALMPVQQQLDDALAATSRQYASARDAYRTASQHVDAVDTGRELSRGRNRVDDTLETFGALPDEQSQQSARVGYFDSKIANAETTKGKLPDAARQFTSDSMRRELPVLAAPGEGDRLMRRLGRENTMTDTAQTALGGSKTADNTADIADSGLDPGVIASVIGGNWKNALVSALSQTANAAKGMPPSVIEKLAPALMERNPEVARELFSKSAQTMKMSDETKAKIVAALMSLGSSVPARITP
jgi:hypothetical protein